MSYRKLGQPEVIEGIGGEPLTAVGVGVVELQCRTPSGVGTVTLYEVRHVPKARANLFALRRATDAGARVTIEGRVAQFELGGVVCMEAEEKNGLWEIATAGAKPVEGVWVFDETPRYSMDGAKKAPAAAQKKAQAESVKEKREELVEIELEFDEAGVEPQAEKAKNGATGEPVGAKTPANKETGKKRATRAVATEALEIEEIDLRGSSSENEKTPEKTNTERYPERVRKPATWLEAAKGTSAKEKG